MKTATTIVASLLGLMFIVFGLNFWLKFAPVPMPPVGTPAYNFHVAMAGSGYFAAVKALEVLALNRVEPKLRPIGRVESSAMAT